jgi:hypothetical protein
MTGAVNGTKDFSTVQEHGEKLTDAVLLDFVSHRTYATLGLSWLCAGDFYLVRYSFSNCADYYLRRLHLMPHWLVDS